MDLDFTIVEFFSDEGCLGGDYESVGVYLGPDLIVDYGDYYHDKGVERAEAFIQGYCRAISELKEIENKNSYSVIRKEAVSKNGQPSESIPLELH